ncbi:MAG TPA: class II aldolase/adducin family protein [Armatimonadota bacterium]|nr:class II aldolase/adducin family protein [Armatimonadota bacterium]
MPQVSDEQEIIDQLVAMSQWLGDPGRDYVILGEGNTSARVDDERMYVKASGARLEGITADGFALVVRSKVLAMLDGGDPSTNSELALSPAKGQALDDSEVERGLRESLADPASPRRPSVETLLHAFMLGLDGVNFVGHTHPTAVNAILCSREGMRALAGRVYPDEIVVCGMAPVLVDYVDPGVPLARAVRDATRRYSEERGYRPQAVLMQNHGLIALGATPTQVEAVTATWVKTARIITGAMAFGGPRHLSEEHVRRICTRPDEAYRRKGITGNQS